MKLYVPHIGHFEGLEELLAGSDNIYAVYMAGSPEYVGTGRTNLSTPKLDEIAQQTEYAHSKGVKMEIVLNSSCMGGQHLTPEGYRAIDWYFDKLNSIGIDSITVADPYLVEMLAKDYDMDVVVSVLSFVDTPQKAEFYEQLGATTIVVDPAVNRHFDKLEAIKDTVSCKLKLLVNEACLYQCPFRYAHFNFFSHANGPGPKPNVLDDYYYYKCLSLRIKDPQQIIKSPWIRPEDLKEYKHITDTFKIGGRTHFVNWILNNVEAYANERYDGNLMDLLDSIKDLKDTFYIPNRELDGAIEQWKKCDKVCHKCGYCKRLAEKVIHTYSGSGEDIRKIPLGSIGDRI
ncbi:protease [Methanococcoides methylutens]|uniref:Protease n=1 Tax=Methanococcoides methylutens TaxID=2226 RepID=A0A099T1Z0_METMT|nr:peptidase U32 family protein [Methanococcoides methylutens]KGK98266.1 protease [Methanococcoides methylutens]